MAYLIRCPNCKQPQRTLLRDLFPDDYEKRLVEYHRGALVQDAFPGSSEEHVTAREQLLTGLCSHECFIAYIGPEEEE